MSKYIFKRVLQFLIVLFIISVLIFLVIRITPTDPIASITKGKHVSEETVAALKAEYHLDKPLLQQYWIWISGMLRGDLGTSFIHRESVNSLLAVRYPVTLQLVLMSAVLIIFIAIPLGMLSAAKMNTFVDQALTVISLILVSSPSFFTGIILMLLFTMVWPIFPTFGTGSNFIENLRYLALPAIALAAVRMALEMRITRSNMVEQLSAQYSQTAKAKGLPKRRVVMKHALKNAMIPIMTVTSLDIAGMMGGSVMVEKVFSLNGVGTLLVEGIDKSDYPITQSLTIIMVLIFMVCNLLVDIAYAVVDPRIRLK